MTNMIKTVVQPPKSIIEDAHKVLDCLTVRGKMNDELALETGLSPVDVAFALKWLIRDNVPAWVEPSTQMDIVAGTKTVKYYLTLVGRRNLKPPPEPDWSGIDVNPRVKPKTAQRHHFPGMQENATVDRDGHVLLGGAQGKILTAIQKTPDITLNSLVEAVQLPLRDVQSRCANLEFSNIITSEQVGKKTTYREVIQPVKEGKKEVVNKIPGTDILYYGDEVPIAADVEQDIPKKVCSSLEEEVQGLLKKYPGTDICLVVMAHMDAKIREYEAIKKITNQS